MQDLGLLFSFRVRWGWKCRQRGHVEEDAAIEFLMQHEDLWSSWVSADAAAKIKAGL